jgi:asparagine N-glycosylation enzyme membrane subunit Stt3
MLTAVVIVVMFVVGITGLHHDWEGGSELGIIDNIILWTLFPWAHPLDWVFEGRMGHVLYNFLGSAGILASMFWITYLWRKLIRLTKKTKVYLKQCRFREGSH